MGYDRHHIIVVTGGFSDNYLPPKKYSPGATSICAAQAEAISIFGRKMVSEIKTSPINDHHTFFVAPDGSNEGWEESDAGDECRDKFIAWLNSKRYEDGSTSLKWAEVQYGDDAGENKVVRDDSKVDL